MTVGLVMIVKDEAPVIGRCLASARPLIDTWTIVDTGSSDRTCAIVRQALRDLPGRLLSQAFQGFGESRTAALRAASGTADYHLMLDADMTVEGTIPEGQPSAFRVTIEDGSGFEYQLPLLLRDEVPWVYTGATHEWLGADTDEPLTYQPATTMRVVHHLDGSRRPSKFTDDLAVLARAYQDDPSDPRTVFYLARTFEDLGFFDQAVALYRERTTMGGSDEERFYARYQLGCLLASRFDFAEGAAELIKAWQERPGRVEPLRALANSANDLADKKTLPAGDVLFVHRDQYAPAS